MQKLNVLFISSWYPSREHPTLGNFIEKHAESVSPFVNLEVVYIVSSENNKIPFEVDFKKKNGVNTTIVYYKKVKNKLSVISNLIKYRYYKKAFKVALNTIEKRNNNIKFDITHCNISFPAGNLALYIKKKYNIPYVISENWTAFLPLTKRYERFNFLIKKTIKKSIEKASLILPVSEYLAKSMHNLGLKQTYEVVYNVVDTNLFTIKEFPKKDKIEILHVSTMDDAHKNISGMFRVLKKIALYRNDFILRIVSDDNFDNTERLIKKFELEDVILLEKTKDTHEIVIDFKRADFFLLFSNYETFSVVLAESWSCGVPAVYSKCGGLTDIKNSELGIQIEAKNEKQLEDAIVSMLDTNEEYNKNNIRQFALANFDKQAIGKHFLSVYKRVLGL